jgi:hypothetical protein
MSSPRRETSARRDHPDKRRTLSMPLIRCARFTPRLATFEGRITVISYVSSIASQFPASSTKANPEQRAERCSTIGCMAGTLTIAGYHQRMIASPTALSQPVTKSRTVCTPRSSAPPSQHHPGAERCRPSIRPYPAPERHVGRVATTLVVSSRSSHGAPMITSGIGARTRISRRRRLQE